MKYDVVIAGGGFAGAYAARELGRLLGRRGEKRVALISERNVLVFQPMLAEVAGSSLTPTDVVNPLRLFCRGVDVLQGVVQKVDWARRTLTLDGGRFTRDHRVPFEHLVLALGTVTDLSRVPGMAEYGRPMKSVADALRLRSTVINRLEEANLVRDARVRAHLLTFVIVGGGYTGVETAGQLLDFVRQAQRYYANLRTLPLRVVLVHSKSHLLPEIGEKLGDYARRELEQRGMEVRLNTRVVEITAGKVILAAGDFIEAHTVVSTIGSAPNPVGLDLCAQLGIAPMEGRIPVESSLRVVGQTHLWAVGDGAAVPWNDRGAAKLSPPTAQFASRQGRQVGRNLLRALRGRELSPFTYRYLGQMASIGERQAVAEVMGFRFSGFIAWWLWRTVYLAKLPGVVRRLRVMIDWTFELCFPRDLSLLMPPPEDLLRAIHLETNEGLFQKGDRCRGYYYIRSGAVALSDSAQAERLLPAGSVIDQEMLDEQERWAYDAVATDSADIIVFRGRALELFRRELRLVPMSADRPPAASPAGEASS